MSVGIVDDPGSSTYLGRNNHGRRALDPSLFRYIWRHSRGEQIFLLLVILASLPLSWVALEVPKHIVNDAIQGGAFKENMTLKTLSSPICPF